MSESRSRRRKKDDGKRRRGSSAVTQETVLSELPPGCVDIGERVPVKTLGGGKEHLHQTFLEQDRVGANWFRKDHLYVSKAEHNKVYSVAENNTIAQREVYAQELFRVFNPACPETVLVVDGNKLYAASKGVDLPPGHKDFGFNHLKRDEAGRTEFNNHFRDQDDPKFTGPRYKGLGNVLVMALLMNETDLRLANIGVDANYNMVKIDGDRSFKRHRPPPQDAEKEKNRDHRITPELIAGLPGCGGYAALNWLDHKKAGKVKEDPVILIGGEMKEFRAEVNAALLKAILMPPELMRKLAEHTMLQPNIDLCYSEMLDRQLQMKQAAMLNPEFQAFLQTDAAMEVAIRFSKDLNAFQMAGGVPLAKGVNLLDQVDQLREEQKLANEFQPLNKILEDVGVKVAPKNLTESEEKARMAKKSAPVGAYVIRPGDRPGAVNLRIAMPGGEVKTIVCEPIIRPQDKTFHGLATVDPAGEVIQLEKGRLVNPLRQFAKDVAKGRVMIESKPAASSTASLVNRLSPGGGAVGHLEPASESAESSEDIILESAEQSVAATHEAAMSAEPPSSSAVVEAVIQNVIEFEINPKDKEHQKALTQARKDWAKLDERQRDDCLKQLKGEGVKEKTLGHLQRPIGEKTAQKVEKRQEQEEVRRNKMS